MKYSGLEMQLYIKEFICFALQDCFILKLHSLLYVWIKKKHLKFHISGSD